MNKLVVILMLLLPGCVLAQQEIKGVVLDSLTGNPLDNVSLQIGKDKAKTNAQGLFLLHTSAETGFLQVSKLGYSNKLVKYNKNETELSVLLQLKESNIEEVVVSTGYFQAPKERLSGSYTHIDNKLLNRSASPNLLDRLEGITNGLQFDRGSLTGENTDGSPLLRVRGASTLMSDARPLIVVDNFPFEGDIRSINPNDVESVTVLKDASAASIWGARAGNGVIVINMKKGSFNQMPSVSLQSNFRLTERPDLFFNQNVVRPETVMELQKKLFDDKKFVENNYTRIPLYVELLIKKRDNLIAEEEFERLERLYQNSDVRRDALKYIYRPASMQQYTMQLSGGEKIYRYGLSADLEKDKQRIYGQQQDRFNLSFQNGLKLRDNLNLDVFARYNLSNQLTNDISNSILGNYNLYMPLVDEQGNAMATLHPQSIARYAYQEKAEASGLLDWLYRPVDELYNTELRTKQQGVSLGTNLDWSLPFGLDIKASYYLNYTNTNGSSLYLEDSFYARNLVNRFTQTNGTKIIPEGAVMEHNAEKNGKSHFGRLVAQYSRSWKEFQLSSLAGLEISSGESAVGYPFIYFGYNETTKSGTPQNLFTNESFPTKPRGLRSPLPIQTARPSNIIDRSLSSFANVGLTWSQRYILNGSIRWDGSNLLGVKTNARGVALWSMGGAWNLHNESFFNLDSFSLFKLKSTYGSAGNINKSQGHLPVISKRVDAVNARAYATLESPGNPSLRWEQVNTWNAGIDWGLKSGNWSGSLEYYNKHAKDLLSNITVDPTIGVSDGFMQNYANLRTRGFDFAIQHKAKFAGVTIQSNLLLNYSSNKVTKVNMPSPTNWASYITKPYYQLNESSDLLYAVPFHGLSSVDGSLVLKDRDGKVVEDVDTYVTYMELEDLVVAGKKVAPYYSSYRLGVDWKGFTISSLFIGKFGHVARRKSMMQGMENAANTIVNLHMDYYKRWQKPGDELHTTVPATLPRVDYTYINPYEYNEILITPLDYISCKDINLSYQLPVSLIKSLGLRKMEVYGTVNELGIIWKKNDNGVHPEYPNTIYPTPRTYYFGLRANF